MSRTKKKISLRRAMFSSNRLNVFIAALLDILFYLTDIYVAFFLKNAIDSVNKRDFEAMKSEAILAFCVMIIAFILGRCSKHTMAKTINTAMVNYKNAVMDGFLKKSMRDYKVSNTGNYVSIMSNDMNIIREDYLKSMFRIITQGALFIGTVIATVYIDWIMLLVVIIVSVLPILIGVIFGNKIKVKQGLVSKENESYMAFIKDIFMGFSVIKSFNVEDEISKSHMKMNKKAERCVRDHYYVSQLSNVGISASGFLICMGIFGVGGYLVGIGRMTIGGLLAIVQLSNYITMPLQYIIEASNKIKGASVILDKIDELILGNGSIPCENNERNRVDKGNNSEENRENNGDTSINSKDNVEVGDKKLIQKDSFDELIKVEDVSFAYEEDNEILHSVSTSFEKNKSYAIVGGSGSGKSTLLKLLLGYYDDFKGNIKLDDIDIKGIEKENLYNLMSVVSQDVFMFDDSIKNNIALYKDYSKDRIDEVISIAGMSDFVDSKGIDYMCGENGSALSGGQSQRVAIARALIKNTPILMMDEAMASLDYQTATKLEEQLQSIKNLTRIVVTHNISKEVLSGYDKIIMMKRGKIVEEGTYDELMDKKGNFYSLVMLEDVNI